MSKPEKNIIWVYIYPLNHPKPPRQRISHAAMNYAVHFRDLGNRGPSNTNPGNLGSTVRGSVSRDSAEFYFEEISHGERGKPYFKNFPSIGFSVSHSGEFWICALGHGNIGADIQQIKGNKSLAVAKRFFHPNEYAFLQNAESDSFFDVWAAKESYVKFTGTGITGEFSSFSVVNDNGCMSESISVPSSGEDDGVKNIDLRCIPFHCNYKVYLCAGNISGIEVFSFVP